MLAHLLFAALGDASFAKTLILRAGRNTSGLHDANEGVEQGEVFKGLMQIAHDCHTQLLTTRTVITRLRCRYCERENI